MPAAPKPPSLEHRRQPDAVLMNFGRPFARNVLLHNAQSGPSWPSLHVRHASPPGQTLGSSGASPPTVPDRDGTEEDRRRVVEYRLESTQA